MRQINDTGPSEDLIHEIHGATHWGQSAPPVPARTVARQPALIHRPLKSPARLPSIAQGMSKDKSSTSRHNAAPPIPSRAPLSSRVHLSSCPPAPDDLRDGKALRFESSTSGSPAKLVMLDVRRNSGHSVLMQTSRGGRATIVTLPDRTGISSSNKNIGNTVSSPDSISERVVTLSHWPIRQSPPEQLPLEGSPGPRARRANEYVDNPSLTAINRVEPLQSSSLPEVFRPHGPGVNLRDCQEVSARVRTPGSPVSALKWTEKAATTGSPVCQEGIVCSRCGKCRCSNCALPCELPRRWVGERECSAQCAVDACTCLWCVRCLFFHTRKSEEEDYSDEPCACMERPSCCLRWSVMSFLAFTCLPCLLCYLPARCAMGACKACYNSYRVIGCRCEQSNSAQVSGAKGLLTPESESSSY